MGISKFNQEGYYDPVAYQALMNIEAERKAMRQQEVKMPIVYICSPYAGNVKRNVCSARVYSRFALDEGCIPITPHLLYPQFMDEETERELGLKIGRILLGKCREVWVFGHVISDGMAKEIMQAKKWKRPVRYFTDDLEEVPEWSWG